MRFWWLHALLPPLVVLCLQGVLPSGWRRQMDTLLATVGWQVLILGSEVLVSTMLILVLVEFPDEFEHVRLVVAVLGGALVLLYAGVVFLQTYPASRKYGHGRRVHVSIRL
mmetsp:Transcript_6480/g.8930  ORF Transcript_6480/g.8930 Transcript_6480/m.8930 type:complete len:111 (+) Transcript_6480:73-405(+)